MRFVAFLEIRHPELTEFIETWKERKNTNPNIKLILPLHISAEPINGITGILVFESDDMRGSAEFLSKFEQAGARVRIMPADEDSSLAKELANFKKGKEKAEAEWKKTSFKKITNLGTTKTLDILPLLDWHKSREDLKTEPGVSYLVKTDNKTILFDLGQNSAMADPSPVAHNMKKLGVSINDFDTIVISHNHGDHVGGPKWPKDKTFSLGATQPDIGRKIVYTPVPMTYPGLKPIHAKNPTIIGKGIATTGTISSYLFRSMPQLGEVHEEALAVNVKDKGIVLIVGCGHQTVRKLLERTETLFDEPIYGLIGGLHLPVTGGPVKTMGMYYHEYIATGKPPWEQLTRKELKENIEFLKKRNIKVVGLSPHDSSETSIKEFRAAFPRGYREVKVGQHIEF